MKLLFENKRSIVPIFLTVFITFFGQNFAYGNNIPVFTDGKSATRTIAENTAAGTNIGAPIAATDADNDALIYGLHSVVGQDAAAFSIVSTTGQLQTKAALNYEAKNTYVFAVFAQDVKGGRTGISVTINLTNVNEKPIFAKDRVTLTVAENTAADTNIGAPFQATDPDSGDTLTYSLKRGDKDAFSIDPNIGQLRTKAALDYETKQTYSDLAVRVTDSAGLTGAALVTISVTDVAENNAPVFTDGSSTTRTIAENTAAGQNIGTPIAATDADNDTLIYTLNGDPDASAFSIISTSGQLQTNAALDYETKSSYAVTVSVSDSNGGSDSISVTIKLTDVTEPSITPLLSDRTPQVRDAIVAAVPGVNNANDVTKAHLARITNLNLRAKGISALKTGDFAGLSSLREIELAENQLRTLPTDIFSGLSSLRVIYLNLNQLTSLPEKLFEGLTALEHLYLNNNQLTRLPEKLFNGLVALRQINSHTNQLTSLPPEVFSGLSSLLELFLHNNRLTEVPAGVFSGLPLIRLSLHGNRLTDLPAGVFSGLPLLTALLLNNNQLSTLPTGAFRGLTLSMRLWLHGNTVDPLPLVVSLEKVGANGFKAVVPAGAPFGITLPVSVANGSISGGATTVTIPQGSVESGTLSVTRTPGTTAAVTVSIGTLPGLPANHQGYRPTKSATLPLTVISPSANTAPVFTEGTSATRTIAENTGSGENIGSAVAATDADNDTLTYTLGGDDASSFSIVSTTGQLQTRAALDYETQSSYSVRVSVSDSNGGSDNIDVTIDVSNVNEAPTFTEGDSATRTIAENTAAGENIGAAVAATDVDANTTLVCTLGGTDAASFSINGTTGQLQTRAALDYETQTSYSVTLTVSDGSLTDRIDVTITVTDVNDSPIFTDGDSTTRTVAENTASGENVGAAVAATDADTEDVLTYSLDGTDASSFRIVSTTGQLQTRAALDYETKSSYSVSVSVSDSKSGSDSIDVTIDVSNVNEAPTFTEGATATRTIAENTAAGVNIGDAVTATDVDANTTLAYTLGGTDASSFSIVGTTGQLQTSAALDYETKNSYSVTVSVSDSNSGRDSITVTIRVTARPFLPVNQRTPGVQREIVNVIRNINSADDVTKEHLAEITGLYFLNITSLKSGDFDGLTNLTTLSLSQNKLASLPSDVFDGLTNLTTLNLSQNKLASLSSDVFDGLTNLTTLYLSYNPFTSLPSGVFDGLTVLTTLYLSENNKLASLPSDVFDGLTNLTVLSLRANKFTSLPSGVFDELTALTTLQLSYNPFTSLLSGVFDGLTALTTLYLDNNPFTSLPSGVFDELTALITLNLAYNAISNVSALENMTALTHLYLSGNPISDYGPLSRLKAAIDAIEDHPGIFIDIDINNNIPVFTDGTSTARSIAENTASGTNIGDPVSATDADTDDPLAYTLGGTDAESFSIVSTSGQLQTNAALDYETQSAYTVTVDVAAGFYHSRSRAIHWDGRNRVGEKVASGLYFYTFTAGDFTATRKLLIRK
ncbi:MAG: cadherin domain-containing protein [Candidatus Poribacteria bacterium]|nr:cadherin domain-containing protein [Candidatus Poribacteria bacterium]